MICVWFFMFNHNTFIASPTYDRISYIKLNENEYYNNLVR